MKASGCWLVALVAGCGPIVSGADESTSAGPTTSTSDSPPDPNPSGDPSVADVATGIPPDPATTVEPDPTIDGSDSMVTTDGGTFIVSPDGGVCFTHCSQCDVWAQDCPDGEKCSAWANDGGNSWNATRCSPVGMDEIGDPCTVEGSAVSGIDSCVLGAMCWGVDPDTNAGTCVALCDGTRANPACAGECDACIITNEGVLNLCLPQCHPAADECGAGEVCLPFEETFVCGVSAATVELGEPCQFEGECVAGLHCTAAIQLPTCDGAACCAPWCDPNMPSACDAVPGTMCAPVAPPVDGCFVEIGACVLP